MMTANMIRKHQRMKATTKAKVSEIPLDWHAIFVELPFRLIFSNLITRPQFGSSVEMGSEEESGKDWSDLEREAAEDDANREYDANRGDTHKSKKSTHDRRDKHKSSKHHRYTQSENFNPFRTVNVNRMFYILPKSARKRALAAEIVITTAKITSVTRTVAAAAAIRNVPEMIVATNIEVRKNHGMITDPIE